MTERPKLLPPNVILVGGEDMSSRAARFFALSHQLHFPVRASITAPPVPAPGQTLEKQEKPVLARTGGFLRRAAYPFFAPSVAPNKGAILAELNAFYSRRPRPWRPKANAPRVRRRAYTAPKARACS